ncbi:hypothetical protein [Candidatus Lokiarchaeum ossiferum]|uniref:hypothetical protein n=1 Tax=Candidatus Lokiarchaeum ossiferum TaxID=2951803 RepID=UPI00352EBDCA
MEQIFDIEKLNMDYFKTVIRSQTAKFVEMNKDIVESETPCSEKALKIAKTIRNGDFGCRTESVLSLVSEIIGEEIPKISNKRIRSVNFALMVLTEKYDGHSYPLNEPILIVDNDSHYALNNKAEKGNHYPREARVIRFATEEEIETFFTQIEDKLLECDLFWREMGSYITLSVVVYCREKYNVLSHANISNDDDDEEIDDDDDD